MGCRPIVCQQSVRWNPSRFCREERELFLASVGQDVEGIGRHFEQWLGNGWAGACGAGRRLPEFEVTADRLIRLADLDWRLDFWLMGSFVER